MVQAIRRLTPTKVQVKAKYSMKKTYLCVKQHKKTGLKYFCKTTQSNPIKYPGSGVSWRKHLHEYGWEFDTIECWEFDDQEKCSAFAINFSIENNIVESSDWANLKIENGKDGGTVKGHKKPPRKPEHTEKHRQALLGKPQPWITISNRTRVVTPESNVKRSEALIGIPKQKIICPHCNKEGGLPQMKRYHYDNCKKK